MIEISGRRAGCGESRTSGSGEGARKHGRLADAVRHAPIPHFEQIEAFFGAERKLSGILAPHVGKFFKSDALLKLPSGKKRAKPTVDKTMRVFRMFLIWAKETGRIKKLPLPKDTPMGRSQKEDEDDE
jgi:hypothetical protein